MNLNKEKWIDEVLESTHNMHHVEPRLDLYAQIRLKLNKPAAVRGISMPLKQWVAAAVLLLALNISSIVYFMDHRAMHGNSAGNNPLASEIQTESTYNY